MNQTLNPHTLMLHVLRNPYGWDEDAVRDACLKAADLIEQFELEHQKQMMKKKYKGFVGYGLFNSGRLVTCSKEPLQITIGTESVECLPLFVLRDEEKIDDVKTANTPYDEGDFKVAAT